MSKHLFRGLGLGSILLLAAASCVQTGDPELEDLGSGADRSGDDIQSALSRLPEAHVLDVDGNGVPSFIVGKLGRLEVSPGARTADVQGALATLAQVFRA